MPIKTILVPVPDLSQARSAVETAFLVARRFDGHVVGLHVRPTFNKDKIEAVMELASLGKSSPLLRETGDAPVFAEDEDTQAASSRNRSVRR